MELRPKWEFVADRVMGGASRGAISRERIAGRTAMRLTGRVSLQNDGGFLQMAFDLMVGGGVFDASGWTGLELDVIGNGERYDLRLRTDRLSRPWQSYRTPFEAPRDWQTLRFPFDGFQPHRTDVAFDPARLRRVGVVAVGRAFDVGVAVAGVRLHPAAPA